MALDIARNLKSKDFAVCCEAASTIWTTTANLQLVDIIITDKLTIDYACSFHIYMKKRYTDLAKAARNGMEECQALKTNKQSKWLKEKKEREREVIVWT